MTIGRKGIVVTDQAFGNVDHERALAMKLGVPFSDHQCRTEEETIEVVRDQRAVLVNFAPITAKVVEAMNPGTIVIRYGIGYDNVDIAAASNAGVRVCNVPDYGVDTVADHAVTLLLDISRRVTAADRAIRDRNWITPGQLGVVRGFSETTVGLVGLGRIGRAVAHRLRAFGFDVIGADPYVSVEVAADAGVRLTSLEKVFSDSHVISLHAPLTPESRHLVDDERLASMRPGALIVNTSRGSLIDEQALHRALVEGRIGGAALDVFEEEPLPGDSGLRHLENVVLTPHAAFYSMQSLDSLQRMAAEEAERGLTGQPLRCEIT